MLAEVATATATEEGFTALLGGMKDHPVTREARTEVAGDRRTVVRVGHVPQEEELYRQAQAMFSMHGEV